MYCAIEGIDTSGKSTQIAALKEIFKEALFTFEPGATEIGREIRSTYLNTICIAHQRQKCCCFWLIEQSIVRES